MKKRSFTPYIILAAFIFIVSALTSMIFISFNLNPPQNDNRFMRGYHDVDKNFNTIVEDQAKFDAKYSAAFAMQSYSAAPIEVKDTRGKTQSFNHSLAIGQNGFEFALIDRASNAPIADANITALISRYDTDKYDRQPAAVYDRKAQKYKFVFALDQGGRYRITVRAQTKDGSIGYFETSAYAK